MIEESYYSIYIIKLLIIKFINEMLLKENIFEFIFIFLNILFLV